MGSVGTRCWVILLLGRDSSDPLFLQAKEAPRSVLERFAGRSEFSNQGQRVVEGQRLMQAASDIFLGWLREPPGLDDLKLHDFYVRQLWDSKISFDIDRDAHRPIWLSTRDCARRRSPAPTRDQATRSQSPATSVPQTPSIAPSPSSPRPTPIRTSATTQRSFDAIATGRIQAQTER